MTVRKRFRGINKLFKKDHSIKKSIKLALDPNGIIIHWPSTGGAKFNFGDRLNPYLVQIISDKRVYNAPEVINFNLKNEYKVIGSSLGKSLDSRLTVWGTGFISYKIKPTVAPKKICAVRGPLSRKKYLDANINCPDVYGDAALLLPRYLPAVSKKRYKTGFVAQWRDIDEPVVREIDKIEHIKFINIQNDIESFVTEINNCERIITSSLHALITCDAYEIPSLWVRISENPLGDLFKFQDYYESIGIKDAQPENLNDIYDFSKLIDKCTTHDLNIDIDKLLDSCPFTS